LRTDLQNCCHTHWPRSSSGPVLLLTVAAATFANDRLDLDPDDQRT